MNYTLKTGGTNRKKRKERRESRCTCVSLGFFAVFVVLKVTATPFPAYKERGGRIADGVREFDFILRLATQQAIGADVIERRVEATAAHRHEANLGI